MIITQPHELQEVQTIKALIYGQMGIGKTTLALSAPNPLLIDIERGLNRVAPQHRCPSLQVNSYEEILELINSKEIMQFDTIVIDTLGKMIYLVLDYLAKSNPKIKQADGSPSQKGWGAIKSQIVTNFYKTLESKNKSIIFIAHEKEKQENEITIKRPDVAGSTDASLVTDFNLVGYMEIQGKNRTIDFCPSENYYAKNSLGFENKIVIPNVNNKSNTFLQDEVLNKMSDRAIEQAEELKVYKDFIEKNKKEIVKVSTVEEANKVFENLGNIEHIWDSKFVLWRELLSKTSELKFTFDKENKVFTNEVHND